MTVTDDNDSNTPEGFESVYGVPIMTLQFHPESCLSNMDREADASDIVKEFSQQIFRAHYKWP